jgi:hypothetical protein
MVTLLREDVQVAVARMEGMSVLLGSVTRACGSIAEDVRVKRARCDVVTKALQPQGRANGEDMVIQVDQPQTELDFDKISGEMQLPPGEMERRLGILMGEALRENGMDTAGTCGEMEGMYVDDTPSGNDNDEDGNGGREDTPCARGSMADAVETERPMVTVAEMGSGEPMMGASGCKTGGVPRVSEHGHGRMGERDAAGAGGGFNVEHFEDMTYIWASCRWRSWRTW